MKKIKLVRIEDKHISTAEKYLKIINRYGRQNVLVSMYENWQGDEEFIPEVLFGYYRTFINKLKEEIPFETLTESDLRVMGFGEWDNEKHLFLIPLLLWEYIPDGTEVVSIMGEKCIKGKDKIDDDTRDGYLAYCITPPVK